MKFAYYAFVGLLFGIGLVLSGMVDPNKVLNFFDLFGTWDPSLAFVMGGGLLVNVIGYQLIFRRGKPLFEADFSTNMSAQIDTPLITGAALFGVGWGIAGFCPGPAIVALGLLNISPFVFVIAVILGMSTVRFARKMQTQGIG